jgi:hypothetical protein
MSDFDQQIEQIANQLERQAERDAERAERRAREALPQLSPEERQRRAVLAERLSSLQLARARIVEQIAASQEPRYRARLEQSLAALDAEIAGLDEG